MDFSLTLEIGVVYDSTLQYEMSDTLANKFMISGLPNLPILDNVSKTNKNINIINDDTNQGNNKKIDLNEKEFQDLYSIFKNNNDIILPDDDSNSNNTIIKKEKKKHEKKKFNFSY
jgi:hypothetical protein